MSEERGVGLKAWLTGPKSKSVKPESGATQVVQMDKRRIVVLPLANISPDPRDEYFADGLTEELISSLSKISELSVISRTSAMSYKGTKRKIGEIGNELNVGSVLEGSVRKSGSRMRIAVELIDAGSDKHLWAETYDREFDDSFFVQSDIAKQVADALRVRILPAETQRIGKKPTTSSEAYGLYLKGRYFWNKRTTENVLKAIQHFEQAITIDPKFALAYSGIADSYSVLSDWQQIPYIEGFQKGEENASRAVQLDESSAEAHTSLANALTADYDWDHAEREFKKAIELNPNYATAHHWYGILLSRLGRFDEALAEGSQAQLLDPLSPQIAVSVCILYDTMKKYDLAESLARKVLELEPDYVSALGCLDSVYIHQGRYAEAETIIKELLRITNGHPLVKAWRALGYACEGRKEEARAILDELETLPPETYVGAEPIIYTYLAMGEKEKAIKLVEKEYEIRANWLPDLVREPHAASIRSDPRVIKVLKKIGVET